MNTSEKKRKGGGSLWNLFSSVYCSRQNQIVFILDPNQDAVSDDDFYPSPHLFPNPDPFADYVNPHSNVESNPDAIHDSITGVSSDSNPNQTEIQLQNQNQRKM